MVVTSSRNLVQKARMQGINAVNFDYLANAVLRMCGRSGIRKISRKSQEIIVEDIINALLRDNKIKYFAGLVSKKGFLRSVTSLLDQLGCCGATLEEIGSAFFCWDGRPASYRQKDRDVAEIYGAYMNYLIAHDIYDMEGLYRLAAAELTVLRNSGERGILKWKTLYFQGFYQFDALQLEIIRQLGELLDVWIALPYEANRPDLYGVTEFTYGDLMQYAEPTPKLPAFQPERSASVQHILQNFRNPSAKPVPVDGSIEIWRYAGQTEEIRGVLRDIKTQIRSKNIRPEEVAIVVRRMDAYSGIRALCDEYGIPAKIEDLALVAANPLFKYILSLLSLPSLHGREKTEGCIDFLTQPLQRIIFDLRTDSVMQIASEHYYTDYTALLADVEKNVGCASLVKLWQAVEQLPSEASVTIYCEQLTRIFSLLDLKVKAGKMYQNDRISLAGFKNLVCVCDEILALLQKIQQDYRICRCEDRILSSLEFAELLQEAAEPVSVLLQPENAEGVSVLPAANLEDASFRQVYVLGLRENEFPFLKKESWIYNDRERSDLAALGIILPCSADGYKEDVHFFANVCASAKERLVFTFSEDEESKVSPYIGEILALFTDLKIQEKAPVKHPEECLSREELALALGRQGNVEELRMIVGKEVLEAGYSDLRRKQSKLDWCGLLSDQALVDQVNRIIGNRFSASKLETYRGCPFRFLASYGWKQQLPEKAEEELNPMQRGNLFHTVLERFIKNHLGEQLTMLQWEKLREEIDRIFSQICREMTESGVIYAGDFWEHDKEVQRAALHNWLRNEISYSNKGTFRPEAVEQDFGRNGIEGMQMQTGPYRIYLNGKIDRIDKAGNRYYITDYKSGNAPGKKDFLDTDIQLPLYLLATEELFAAPAGGSVAGGGYFVIKDGKRKESFRFAEEANIPAAEIPWKTYTELTDNDGNKVKIEDIKELKGKTEDVIKALLDRVYAGDFVPTPAAGCDANCPAANICRFAILNRDCDEEAQNE